MLHSTTYRQKKQYPDEKNPYGHYERSRNVGPKPSCSSGHQFRNVGFPLTSLQCPISIIRWSKNVTNLFMLKFYYFKSKFRQAHQTVEHRTSLGAPLRHLQAKVSKPVWMSKHFGTKAQECMWPTYKSFSQTKSDRKRANGACLEESAKIPPNF